MKFLVDAQLPRRLSEALKSAGHDSVHTLDLPNGNKTTDREINTMSIEEQRIVISKDSDFVESLLVSEKPYKLLYLATGNITNRVLQQLLEKNMAEIEKALENHRLVELTPESLIIH